MPTPDNTPHVLAPSQPTCARARPEGSPVPVVVLGVEQKVGAHDSHAGGHDEQDEEHQQHEAVHVVHLQVMKESGSLVSPSLGDHDKEQHKGAPAA